MDSISFFRTVAQREIYLLRKYGTVWLRKTFGRISPTRAHIFFLWRLKEKFFYLWHEDICHKIRWTLTIRADCNNKFRLLAKCINAWKQFIVIYRTEKERELMADKLQYKIYAKIYFPAMREFVLMRRFDKQQVTLADEFNARKQMEQSFHIWLEELAMKKVFNEMGRLSLSFYSAGVLKWVWSVWLFRIKERNDKMQSILFADNYYNFKLVRNSFEVLREYTLHRRNTKILYWNLKQDYQHRVLGCYLKRWCVRRLKEENLRDKQKQIEELAHCSKMRRCWLEWQDYTLFRRLKREREVAARNIRKFSLKSHSWRCMVRAYRQTRVNEWNRQIALNLWVLWRYRHAWDEWEMKMDQRTELKQRHATDLARSHHARVLLARSFQGIQTYWVARKVKKERYRRIEEFYETTLQRKCVTAFKLYHCRQRLEREHSNLSNRFLREIIFNRYFYMWVDNLDQQRENGELLERVHYNHSYVMLRTFFLQWKDKYRMANNEKMRLLTAEISYRISLQKNVFFVWKQFVVLRRERKEAKIFARNNYQTRISRKCFFRMKQLFDRNEFIRRQCQQLVSLLGMTSVRKTFIAWKQYIVLVREEHLVMLRAQTHYNVTIESQALKVWRENVEFVKMQKAREKLAGEFRNRCLVNECFQIWRFTQVHVYEKRLHEHETISKVRVKINRSCLARCFWGWLNLRDRTVIKRYDKMKADNYHSYNLMSHSLSQWKKALVARKRYTVMYQRAGWFHLSAVLARTYTQWRLQLSIQRYHNHRSTLALWCWSRALERRVFVVLRRNASENRRKKERYERAADQFKERVVRKGILQILHAGNVMITADENSVLRNIERSTKYSWGCALKYARIWRQRAASRKKTESRQRVRCALSVPNLPSNLPRQSSGVERFWSEMTEFTVRGRTLPAPRIPDFMKQTDNQISSAPTPVCQVLPEAISQVKSHTDTSELRSQKREEMIEISNSDLNLLQTTKQQLIQVYKSKLLLKSVREKLSISENLDVTDTADETEIRKKVQNIEDTIRRLESSIKHNIDSFTQHFSVTSNIQNMS